jgi:hypothetical protein
VCKISLCQSLHTSFLLIQNGTFSRIMLSPSDAKCYHSCAQLVADCVFLSCRASYFLPSTLFSPAGLPLRNEADLPHMCMQVSMQNNMEQLT